MGGGANFEMGEPIFGRGVLDNMPIPLFEQPLSSSPVGVFSRDYGSFHRNALSKCSQTLLVCSKAL